MNDHFSDDMSIKELARDYIPTKTIPKVAWQVKSNSQNQPNARGLSFNDLKLTSYLKGVNGEAVPLVVIERTSLQTSLTQQAIDVLQRYLTDNIAFLLVVGTREAGKSLFCDKILNLCDVKGNNFCSKTNLGINMWSTPFVKENVLVFLLEINGCEVGTKEFEILATYAILICSGIINIRHPKEHEHHMNSFEDLDQVFAALSEKITSKDQTPIGVAKDNRNVFMPSVFFNLSRDGQTKVTGPLKVLHSYVEEQLPNAMQASYKGQNSDLLRVPLFDKECFNEKYVHKIASIFRSVLSLIRQKCYNELIFNGTISLKMLKYIQLHVNSNREISTQIIYQSIVEDLYLSAYNFCILSYHEDLEVALQDEQPKSLSELINILDVCSQRVVGKFNQFTLDRNLHQKYEAKLLKYIDKKEEMIIDINKKKTIFETKSFLDKIEFGNPQNVEQNIRRFQTEKAHLDHGSEEVILREAIQIMKEYQGKGKGDYASRKAADRLNEEIAKKRQILAQKRQEKEAEARTKSKMQQEAMILSKQEKETLDKVTRCRQELNMLRSPPTQGTVSLEEKKAVLERTIAQTDRKVEMLKNSSKKSSSVVDMEKQLDKITASNREMELLITELSSKQNQLPLPAPSKEVKKKPKPKDP